MNKASQFEGMDMKHNGHIRIAIHDNKGVVAVVVALLLVVFIGAAALAVDVGRLAVSKNELQNAADAAALAAARRLGAIYENMANAEAYILPSADEIQIEDAAIGVALRNRAAGANITVVRGDIFIGTWDPAQAPDHFTEGTMHPNAVRVITRRDAQVNNPVSLFFARIFGIQAAPVRAVATAALTGQSTSGPGGLPIPVGISRRWFTASSEFNFCNQPIRFYPTNDPTSCAGWHLYDRYANFNDSRLRDTIGDLDNHRYESPETTATETRFEFGGGTMSTHTFAAMHDLWIHNLNRDLNGDGTMDAWETSVPVYEEGYDPTCFPTCDNSDCSNPQGEVMIIGFATIVITGVTHGPPQTIDGYVICDSFATGRGGGGNFGTMGTIPGLVQ